MRKGHLLLLKLVRHRATQPSALVWCVVVVMFSAERVSDVGAMDLWPSTAPSPSNNVCTNHV